MTKNRGILRGFGLGTGLTELAMAGKFGGFGPASKTFAGASSRNRMGLSLDRCHRNQLDNSSCEQSMSTLLALNLKGKKIPFFLFDQAVKFSELSKS